MTATPQPSKPRTPAAFPPERRLLGIGLMVVAIGFYAFQDAIAKHIANTYSPIQILFFRAAGSALVLIPLIGQIPRGGFLTKQPLLMLFRCFIGAFGMGCYIMAFRSLPLADVSAIGFSGVLMATVASMVILKERVDAKRWAAIVAGFVGVLIILRPGASVVSPGAIWALAGALGFVGLTTSLRLLGRTDHPVAITWHFVAFSLAVLGAMLPPVWIAPDAAGYAWLLAQGVLCGAGQVLMSASLKIAPASTVSPFTYTIIIFGIAIGFFWFGDVPEPLMLLGTGVLIGSCLFIAHIEREQSPRA